MMQWKFFYLYIDMSRLLATTERRKISTCCYDMVFLLPELCAKPHTGLADGDQSSASSAS